MRLLGPKTHLTVLNPNLSSTLAQEVTEAPKVAGPDALLKQKIKQKRFRWAGVAGVAPIERTLLLCCLGLPTAACHLCARLPTPCTLHASHAPLATSG